MTAGGYDPNQYPQGNPYPQGNQYPQGNPNPYPQGNPYGGQQPFPNAPYGNQGIGPQPADVWLRFAARLIDGLIIWIPTYIIVLALFDFGSLSALFVLGILLAVLPFVYFVAFEVTQGWTPGKKLLGLSVRGPNGAPKPDLQQSATRNAFLLLAIIPFYIGTLLYLAASIVIAVTINNSPTKQGKHDEIAGGTIVLKG